MNRDHMLGSVAALALLNEAPDPYARKPHVTPTRPPETKLARLKRVITDVDQSGALARLAAAGGAFPYQYTPPGTAGQENDTIHSVGAMEETWQDQGACTRFRAGQPVRVTRKCGHYEVGHMGVVAVREPGMKNPFMENGKLFVVCYMERATPTLECYMPGDCLEPVGYTAGVFREGAPTSKSVPEFDKGVRYAAGDLVHSQGRQWLCVTSASNTEGAVFVPDSPEARQSLTPLPSLGGKVNAQQCAPDPHVMGGFNGA